MWWYWLAASRCRFLLKTPNPLSAPVVRRARQTDLRLPGGAILQQRLDPAIAFLLMLAQDQAGEQLWQRKVLATEFAPIIRKESRGQQIGTHHHPPWRFAGCHPAWCSDYQPRATEQAPNIGRIETEQFTTPYPCRFWTQVGAAGYLWEHLTYYYLSTQ